MDVPLADAVALDESFGDDIVPTTSAAAVAMLNDVEDEEAIELDDDDLEGLEDDTDASSSLLEPQVILEGGGQASKLQVQIDDRYDTSQNNDVSESDATGDGFCHVCQAELSTHFAGQPCGTFDDEDEDESSSTVPPAGHFLFDDSTMDDSNSCSSTSHQQQQSLKKCPVCAGKNPSREHLANHFMSELTELIPGQQTACRKCDFQTPGTSSSGVKNQSKILALHSVTDHGGSELDELLQDGPLVQSKKAEFDAKRPINSSSTSRQSLGPMCPICDQQLHKQHSRDHVSWHFMEELRDMIKDPSKCPECAYTGDKTEAVSRHLALYHCKLDEFLENSELVAMKRAKAMSKPKKVTIGPSCPICGIKDPAREHVSRHFMNELMELVADLEDPMQCPDCNYRGEKSQNVARHIALVHSRLDALLANSALVKARRAEFLAKPNKINIGAECPVCDQSLTKQHSRVHVIWHFIDELREIVNSFKNPTKCDFCSYKNHNSDKVVKHIALGHSKLDAMLQDRELLKMKRSMAKLKPKRESIGPSCPICDVRDPPREHVARHFGDELNDYVSSLPDQLACSQCNYRGEKPKNLGLHIALVHARLDLYLKNDKLVSFKRSQYLALPKKQAIGPKCPICDLKFTKSQNRDHVAWHFMDELREFVQSFADPQKCWKCDYASEKMDNLVKHVALGHSKLDELLQNAELVQYKRAKALAKPKKVVIGPLCPICDAKEPAREHVARHFSDELLSIVSSYPDPCACMECEYKGDKPKTLSIHVALVHAKLDLMLINPALVEQKRAIFYSKPRKLTIGPKCPVCEITFTKTQNRDHVAWHYMDELRSIVQEFENPSQCPQCPYSADTNEKMVKHVALGHSMLDALLQDEALLEHKRMKALNKPKKVAVGSLCPICDAKEPAREHVSRHFSDELLDIVMGFEDPNQCTQCNYKSDKPKNVSIHIALVHSILDHFLADGELVQSKRENFFSKPQKVMMGCQCPICDTPFAKGQNRDHVCWHFMDELRDYVLAFQDTTMCNECSYSSEKLDNLVKHVALGHSKLDELLKDTELVDRKRELVMSKPKKINLGPSCPVCGIKFTKSQNRDHVVWHFMDELRDFVHSTGSDKACQLCYYTTEKMDNLVKHYALGHSKLDELLLDTDLVDRKQADHARKPKKKSFGPDCPICGEKNRDRDHVSRHFMNELMEMVNTLPDKSECNLCNYTNSRPDYMAKHLALFHCKLDEMMSDPDLVQEKTTKAKTMPKRVEMGEECVICGMGFPQREHVARHFINELLAISKTFDSPLSCAECSFTADKEEYVARHVGLVHRKMDEMLMDSELVARKVAEHNVGSSSSPGGLSFKLEPTRKSMRQAKPIIRDEGYVPMVDYRSSGTKRKAAPFPAATSKKLAMTEMTPAKNVTTTIHDDVVTEFKKEEEEQDEGNLDDSTANEGNITIKEEWNSDSDSSSTNNSSLLKTTLLKPKPAQMADKPMGSLLMNSLLKPKKTISPRPQLPPSISLTPALPKKRSSNSVVLPTKPSLDSASIADLNNSWAESLLNSGKKRSSLPPQPQPKKTQEFWSLSPPKSSSCGKTTIGSCTLTPATGNKANKSSNNNSTIPAVPSISLQKVSSSASASVVKIKRATTAKWQVKGSSPTATITPAVATRPSPTATIRPLFPPPPPLVKAPAAKKMRMEHMVVTPELMPHSDEDDDEDDMDGHVFLEPQVILNTNENGEEAVNEDEENVVDEQEEEEEDDEVEFCDVCSMELEHHAEGAPCPPHDGYVKQHKYCPVCDRREPTREHVARHFMDELGEVVEGFPNPLACTQCDYQSERTSETVALHIALNHNTIREYLEDPTLVRNKRVKFSSGPGGGTAASNANGSNSRRVSLGSQCPVCGQALTKQHNRDHVIWHFMDELRELVAMSSSPTQCTDCDYTADKVDNMARHAALFHCKLDMLLQDGALVAAKRSKCMAKPKKVHIGNMCPVCDFREPSREHVSRHFMNELLDYVATLPDTLGCGQCNYKGERPQNLAKHIALVHNMLDDMLQNAPLLAMRRAEALAKPKKISIGSTCPVCRQAIQKRDSRVHVIWHFMEELREMVQEFPDPTVCNFCPYTNPNLDKMAKHMALGHSKLDELLSDKDLLAIKQQRALAKPKKLNIGPECPICGMQFTKPQNRDHVSWHFMDELREYVQTFQDTQQCNQCEYRTDKVDNLVKHLALGHSKLDELLLNDELVSAKRAMAMAKPKKVSIGPTCPICDLAFTKSQNRDHVSWHFMDELRALVNNEFEDPQACNQCEYRTDKMDNLVKHLALGHSKLDEFLMDDHLVAMKRMQFRNKAS